MAHLALLRLSAVIGVGLFVSSCGDAKPPETQAAPPAVTAVKVVSEDVRPSTSFTGRVQARDKVDLRARVDGFLEKRLFTEGADVKQGELLFVIEKGLYQAVVDEAQAALEKAEAALQLAEVEFSRQLALPRHRRAQ